MQKRFDNSQMSGWIEKLEHNVDNFVNNADLEPDTVLTFIRQQYVLVNATIKVMDGKAALIGASFSRIKAAITETQPN